MVQSLSTHSHHDSKNSRMSYSAVESLTKAWMLPHARTLADKLDAYHSQIKCIFYGCRSVEAMDLAKKVLKRFGMDMQPQFFKVAVKINIFRIKQRSRHFSNEQLLHLAPMTGLIETIVYYGFSLMITMNAGDAKQSMLATSHLLVQTLKHGATPYLSLAMSILKRQGASLTARQTW